MRSIIFALGLAAANAVNLNLELEVAASLPDRLAGLPEATCTWMKRQVDLNGDAHITKEEVEQFVASQGEGDFQAKVIAGILQRGIDAHGYVISAEVCD